MHMEKVAKFLQELLAALIGATISLGLQLIFLIRYDQPLKWQPLVLAAITGAILGWVYRLASGMRKITEDALTRLENMTRMLDFQEEPLNLLITTRRHAETLGLLLSDSMKEKYRFISHVDENKYLTYLMSAI